MNWDDIKYFIEVARTQRVSVAASHLGVRHSTVSRRIHALEQSLGFLLFNKSRVDGFTLTEDGEQFFNYAEQIESTITTARERISGEAQSLKGHLRVGCTEGFGSYILTPLMTDFQKKYPSISLDIMPVPRFISLSKREADIAIALERPQRGPYLCTRLTDYSLRLYATRQYLQEHEPITSLACLKKHKFIGYVEELLFSDRLRYMDNLVPTDNIIFKSTSVIAQFHAALQGHAMAILPTFMAGSELRLLPVLHEEVNIRRSFWMYCHEDLRQSARVMTLWNYLKDSGRDLLL